jgi:acetyltransferase-like isoleucine patch superfamily enzyme
LLRTIVGRYTNVGYDNEIVDAEVGSFCAFSDHVYIGGPEHPVGWVSMSPVFEDVCHSGPRRKFSKLVLPQSKKTIIGHDVWIGHAAIVKAGVKVGHGAVIGAGAVVTKDVPPYAIVVGIPAKIIRYRFDVKTIETLLNIKWWDYSENQLIKFAPYFDNPIKFIEACLKEKNMARHL